MTTILMNRANISNMSESQDSKSVRTSVSAAIVKEIVAARERGWGVSRITKEYNVDSTVVERLDNISLPVDNKDGIVYSC
jgi:hypothetical protein